MTTADVKRILEIADGLDMTMEQLNVALLLSKRVVKTTRQRSIHDPLSTKLREFLLESAPKDIVKRMEVKRGIPKKNIWMPQNVAHKILPILTSSVPPPPSAVRPKGRTLPKDSIMLMILEYLNVKDLRIFQLTCLGFYLYLARDRGIWTKLAENMLRLDGITTKAEFIQAYRNVKHCSILIETPSWEHVEQIFRNDLVIGKFQMFVIDSGRLSAEAAYCAVKCCSPCIIFIRDIKHLNKHEIARLIKLLQSDLSKDSMLLACCTKSISLVDVQLRTCFGTHLESTLPKDAPYIDVLSSINHGLDESEIQIATKRLNNIAPHLSRTIINAVTSRVISRVRLSACFRMQDSTLYLACDPHELGSQDIHLSDIPVHKIDYGPCTLEDILYAIDSIIIE